MLKAQQKMRVITGGVSFYTTPYQIKQGVGDFTKINQSVSDALSDLESIRARKGVAEQCCTGLCGTYAGVQVQLNIIIS